jgi:hypothetical protein
MVQASPPGTVVSFVAIQQLQQDLDTTVGKDKRSLLEIQEEEQALQEEADFLKWWTAEEERVKLEAQASSQTARNNQRRFPKKHRHAKSKTVDVQDSPRAPSAVSVNDMQPLKDTRKQGSGNSVRTANRDANRNL